MTGVTDLLALVLERLGPEGQTAGLLRLCALLLARVAPLSVFAPFFLLRSAPLVLRVGISLVLTVSLTPFALAHASPAPDLLSLPWAICTEALRGALFGLAVALPIVSLEWAGRWLDAARGAQQGQTPASLLDPQSTPLGGLLGLLGVALFFALGAHRVALLAFVRGLEVAPLGAPLQAASFAQHALQFAASVSAALALALSIAAPAVLALILVELALGLLGRTAPQIPLHFAGMPLRAGLALGALLLSLSLWVPRLGELFGAAIGGAPR